MVMLSLVAPACLLLFACAGTAAASLPDGYGLAGKYPGDVGIEQDPAVVLNGTVFEKGAVADPATRTFRIEIMVRNARRGRAEPYPAHRRAGHQPLA